MVLRILVAVLALAGCKQSLFDSHGGDDDDHGGDGSIASSCPTPCLGDGGHAFDGSPMGSDGNWRYLEDHKDRTWGAMTASGDTFVGETTGNQITSCAKHDSPVCETLPGALLFSTAGDTTPVAAVEWIAPSARVVQLQLGVRIPDGAPTQTVRLYRGSREDALFTALADPGVTVQQTITLDVLMGERIYVTLDGGAVDNAGVQLFVVGDMATFPSTCQVALGFEAASGNTVDNLCGTDFTFHAYNSTSGDITDTAPTLGSNVYAEEGMAAQIPVDRFYSAASPLDRTGDFTIQYWMKFAGVVDAFTGGWSFSDLDLDNTGGIGMVLFTDNNSHLALDVQTCTVVTQTTLDFNELVVSYPEDTQWHFVRVVKKGTDVSVCLDGTKIGNKAFTNDLGTGFAPYIGKNVVWTPSEPSFSGTIDDLRVMTQALPCN